MQPLMSTSTAESVAHSFGGGKGYGVSFALNGVISAHVFGTHETATAKIGLGGGYETIVFGNKGSGWRYTGKKDGHMQFEPVP
jgi:hypothetical protein